MAQTSFFGLTSYGAGTTYEKSIAKPLLFHQVPDAVFLDLFHKHALGQSQLATTLQVGEHSVCQVPYIRLQRMTIFAGRRVHHYAY